MVLGVTEFEDCGNVKLPVDTQSIYNDIMEIREVPDNQKVEAFIQKIENSSKNEDWKLQLPDGINLDIAIKDGLLKIIPMSVVTTILSPKVLLGLMVVLKSLGTAIGNTIADKVEDFATFMENFKTYLINLVSRISSVFIEELFKLLKKNIRLLVEVLMVEIIKESKNAQLKAITGVLYVLPTISICSH